jgi:hypothetical protein
MYDARSLDYMMRDGGVMWWGNARTFAENGFVRTGCAEHRSKMCGQMMVFIQDHDRITFLS